MRKNLALNDFCLRQFKNLSSVGYIGMDSKEFLTKVNEQYQNGYVDPLTSKYNV